MKNADHLKVYLGPIEPDYILPQGFLSASHEAEADLELMKFVDLEAMQPEWAGEYYWLFALKRTLCGSGALPKRITIGFEKRSIFNIPVGQPFKNSPHYHCITLKKSENLEAMKVMSPHQDEDWLIGQPLFFGGDMTVTENYHRCHHLFDLLQFSTTAMKFGLPSEYIFNFMNAKFMFPYPSVGTFEVESLFKILDVLENVVARYSKDGWIRREGYQGKNMRFLLERMHSFLLTVHLEQKGLLNKPEIYGYHTIQSELDTYSDQ